MQDYSKSIHTATINAHRIARVRLMIFRAIPEAIYGHGVRYLYGLVDGVIFGAEGIAATDVDGVGGFGLVAAPQEQEGQHRAEQKIREAGFHLVK
jgi:hypothetical protein